MTNQPDKPSVEGRYRIEFDGFVGTVIGGYRRLDGEEGVVMQQDGSKVVHVYRRKWLIPVEPESAAEEPHPPSRHCMCAACRPSFDDEARPPQSAVAPAVYQFRLTPLPKDTRASSDGWCDCSKSRFGPNRG